MKVFIKENEWLQDQLSVGWGNGYVIIPEGHPCHGLGYENLKVIVHGGLTFSSRIGDLLPGVWNELPENIKKDDWIVGFDTCHLHDNKETCPESYVRKNAEFLKVQLEILAEKERILNK